MNREEAKELLLHILMTYEPKDQYGDYDDPEPYEQAITMAIEALSERTGEWIKATGMMPPEFHGHHCCSECGNFANMEPPFGNREDLSKFCHNCGADMRGTK